MKVNDLTIKWFYAKSANENPFTFCEIFKGDKKRADWTGIAICAKGDNFCRATGRKISLARGLKVSDLPKEERAKVWDAYRTMSKKPRWGK